MPHNIDVDGQYLDRRDNKKRVSGNTNARQNTFYTPNATSLLFKGIIMDSNSRQIDNFDRKILNIVQQSNRKTTEQIAELVGLSPAAVQRRLKRLRDQKVILSDIAVLNPKSVGRDITIVVQVELEHERLDLMDEFKTEMKSNPIVQQCYYVTGSSDFILIVTVASMNDYNAFIRDVFFDNDNIRGFETNVVMDRVKVGLFVPTTEI